MSFELTVRCHRILAPGIVIAILLICFVVLAGQTRSASTIDGSLVVADTDIKDKTIKFGGSLDILVTIQNQGTKSITIPPGGLILKNTGWASVGTGGSGLDECPLVKNGGSEKDPVELLPGESVVMLGSATAIAAESTGPMKARFEIRSEIDSIKKELKGPATFSLTYTVIPSNLLISAWSARTTEEQRRLLPEFRELLLLDTESGGWRNRFYTEHTHLFLGCYELPLLESSASDSDPVVRQRTIWQLGRTDWTAVGLDSYIAEMKGRADRPTWLGSVEPCEDNRAIPRAVKLTIAALSDKDPRVRIAAICVLTERASYESTLRERQKQAQEEKQEIDASDKAAYETIGLVDPAIPLVQKMTSDADPDVRSEAQKFLANFVNRKDAADNIIKSLTDADSKVRRRALAALQTSNEPAQMTTLEKAFASARGEIAIGLVELMFEREDSDLAGRLIVGFSDRTAAERLAILTAVAGHTDDAAAKIITLGLTDPDANVRRAAMTRLLGFPTDQALSLIRSNRGKLSPDMMQTSAAVEKEITSRAIFPFLSRGANGAVENIFFSFEGTGPRVSPDGKW
jgi:hypothetical protein